MASTSYDRIPSFEECYPPGGDGCIDGEDDGAAVDDATVDDPVIEDEDDVMYPFPATNFEIGVAHRTMVYATAENETCLENLSEAFTDLCADEHVAACLGHYQQFCFQPYVTEEHFTNFHNFLHNGRCWHRVGKWQSRCTFSIQHPKGVYYILDTERGAKTEIFQMHEQRRWDGTMKDSGISFCIKRKKRSVQSHKLNLSAFFDVCLESTRTFSYESATSAWTFRLSAIWQGATETAARQSPRKFQITVESSDSSKAGRDPRYSAASMCEKIIDACGRTHASTLEMTDRSLLPSPIERQTTMMT
jgi:hypothetical protein